MEEFKSSANSLPSERTGGKNGATYFGSGENKECDTKERLAGRTDYPGKENPAEMMSGAGSGRSGTEIPMNQGNVSGVTSRKSTKTKVPQI